MGISYRTCQRVLTKELGVHRVAAKFVPKVLVADQKQQRVEVCTEIRQLASEDETFLSRVITGHENWIYGYNPEKTQQSSPHATKVKKARQVKSNAKSMTITFFDTKGIVHK
jgi:hypothetical protein